MALRKRKIANKHLFLYILVIFLFVSPLHSAVGGFEFGGAKETNVGVSIFTKLKKKYDEFNFIESIPLLKMERSIDRAYANSDKMQNLWDTFVIADVMVVVFSILLVIFFALLAIVFRKKKLILSISILASIVSYPLVVSMASNMVDDYARTSTIENLHIKTFKYSTNVYIEGDLVNMGKYDFKKCNISIIMYKKTNRTEKDYINRIKPLAVNNIEILDLKVDEFRDFFITIFQIPKDVNFTTEIDNKCI